MTINKFLDDMKILSGTIEIKCVEQVVDDDGGEFPPRPWRCTLTIGQDNTVPLAEIAKHCSESDLARITAVLKSVV